MLLMLSKIMNPRSAVPNKDLQGCITEWERDIEFYAKATCSEGIAAPQHKMFFLRMCSSALRTHLD